MATLAAITGKGPSTALSTYRDQQYKGSIHHQERQLTLSTTLYVGNLSFYTTEEQLHELFSKTGDIKRIIMGLDKQKKTPCGFCFLEYYTRKDAEDCMRYINGTRLDDRIIRTDWDAGFKEGRQYGRGKSGGQVRDEYRTDYDIGRGGYGKIVNQRMGPDIRESDSVIPNKNVDKSGATNPAVGSAAAASITPAAAAPPAASAQEESEPMAT